MIPEADADADIATSVRLQAGGAGTRARKWGIAVGVAITLFVWVAGRLDTSILAASLVFVPAAVVATIDDATGALPDRWVLATAAGGLTWALLESGWPGPAGWLVAALAVAVPIGSVHAIAPAAMGFGDVKFAAAIGGSLGAVTTSSPERVVLALASLAVASAAALAYGVVRRRQSVPFGPCLLLGGGIAMVLAVQGAITT
jgi:prepilin signal peptidase PulO-like enzyme (type II secretory pathway)